MSWRWLLLTMFTLSCSHWPQTSSQFQLRSFKEKTLKNGLRIIQIPDHSLPSFRLSMMIKVGSLHEPLEKLGLNALTVSSLEGGADQWNATQLAEELAQLGTRLELSPGADGSFVSVSGLSMHQSAILKIYSSVIQSPLFPPKEIDRKKSQFVASIIKSIDSPTSYADQVFDREIYGNHPYGQRLSGEVSTIQSLTKTDLIRHYFKYFRPNNAILVVSGDFNSEFYSQIEKAFESWKEAKVESLSLPALSHKENSPIKLYSKRDLKQTQIRMGHLGINRNDPDFLLLRVANLALGGGFASRLNQKIRDDLGLTYSISSSAQATFDRGTLSIDTFTRNEKAAETIRQVQTLMKEFIASGITSEELDAAKALLIGQFPSAIETVDAFGYNLMVLRLYRISDDYLRSYISNIQKINLGDVNASIKRHYQYSAIQTIVYADQTSVLSALKTLGSVEVIPAR